MYIIINRVECYIARWFRSEDVGIFTETIKYGQIGVISKNYDICKIINNGRA